MIRTWKQVAELLVSRVNAYQEAKQRKLSKVCFSLVGVMSLRASDYLPNDADWAELTEELRRLKWCLYRDDARSFAMVNVENVSGYVQLSASDQETV